jgi:hypothetical protein
VNSIGWTHLPIGVLTCKTIGVLNNFKSLSLIRFVKDLI